ncbi:hypothetical protein E5676_scaffold1213G00030 [Cucumis melo var. makuwa]|uniref:Uncharacterized protein n=2 Tax=Cucumis melo TaxID=3656 RepID=A0A5A7VBZ9_CUCMM|nr:hypothetical protein E6C27_scaffold381G00030 [Cucumis melo var. makuwa]TYK27506.1 hypothetical protein E5676_scaffold1213G00030 [Cucumis melo var. makuwa]
MEPLAIHSLSPSHSHHSQPPSPKFQIPHGSPSRQSSVSPSHTPINLTTINLDPEHIDLNVIVVNFFFYHIFVEEDTGKTSSKEEAQLEKEVPAEKEVELHDVIHNVIAEPMNAAFKEVLLENVATKDQVTSLNTEVQGLEAIVSTLNSRVTHSYLS